jgi:hypothetical protein
LNLDESLAVQLRKKTSNVRGYRLRTHVRKIAMYPGNDLIHLSALRRKQTPNAEPDRIETEVSLSFRREEDRAFLNFPENDG